MLVQCPNCLKRYRLQQTQARLLRVRCKGCGSEFLVSPTTGPRHEILGREERATAVVADIQRDFRNLVIDLLNDQGFHLFIVEEGDRALATVMEQKPRLLLVNPYLPGLLGVDLIARIRAEVSVPPIIILMGAIHSSRRYHRRPQSLYGADDYLDEGSSEAVILRKLAFHLEISLKGNHLGEGADAESLRLARSVFADLLVYDPDRMVQVRDVPDFFRLFADEAAEGRRYLEHRRPGAGEYLSRVVQHYLRKRE